MGTQILTANTKSHRRRCNLDLPPCHWVRERATGWTPDSREIESSKGQRITEEGETVISGEVDHPAVESRWEIHKTWPSDRH
ncbi:hypothetical protein TNCT_437761 [Trichonephila clavata]|uniref:Uncharacterized protein n=1 Tax=Trichonephila clavata TaxID=2740835 RepID=A0A8X6GCD6_TRICU|nr:hypothetical protein TNCT_437761 [Trichonephila clavata]